MMRTGSLLISLTVTDLIPISYCMVDTPCQSVQILRGKEIDKGGERRWWEMIAGPNSLGPWFPLFTHQHPAQTGLRYRQQWVISPSLFHHSSGFCFLPAGPSPEPRAQITSRSAAGREDGALCAHTYNLAVKLGASFEDDDDDSRA